MALKNHCGNCKYNTPQGISETWGDLKHDSCVAVPRDAQGNRSKIIDPTRTWCVHHKVKKGGK